MIINSVRGFSANNKPNFKGVKEEQIFERIVNYGLKKAQKKAAKENSLEPITLHFNKAFDALKKKFTKEKYNVETVNTNYFKFQINGEQVYITRNIKNDNIAQGENSIQYSEKRPFFKELCSVKNIGYANSNNANVYKQLSLNVVKHDWQFKMFSATGTKSIYLFDKMQPSKSFLKGKSTSEVFQKTEYGEIRAHKL